MKEKPYSQRLASILQWNVQLLFPLFPFLLASSLLRHFELLLHHLFKKIIAFCFFPCLGSVHFFCTLAKNCLEERSLGASSPSPPRARHIWGSSLFQPAQRSLAQQKFCPSDSTFFFSSWLWLGKSAYKAFCILWMYHTVILLSENSVMSIIDALEKW